LDPFESNKVDEVDGCHSSVPPFPARRFSAFAAHRLARIGVARNPNTAANNRGRATSVERWKSDRVADREPQIANDICLSPLGRSSRMLLVCSTHRAYSASSYNASW